LELVVKFGFSLPPLKSQIPLIRTRNPQEDVLEVEPPVKQLVKDIGGKLQVTIDWSYSWCYNPLLFR